MFHFRNTVNPLLSSPGGLFFSSTFEAGGELKRDGGTLFNFAKCITRARFLEDGVVVTGRCTASSNNKKMVTILHRELEHKVEKFQHMKLEVMRPKTILLASPQTFFSLFPTPHPIGVNKSHAVFISMRARKRKY